MGIHSTALVSKDTIVGKNVEIGPYCIIGPEVILEDNVKLFSHVVIEGRVRVGSFTTIYPFAAIGHKPQDMAYNGEPSAIEIGSHNQIREYVTIHPGTKRGKMLTKIGNHCLLMASSHIAHDCLVEDHVVMANNATLGGHVMVGNHAVLGGLCAIQQFTRIGEYAMISGTSGVAHDVVPYSIVIGNRARLSGLNVVGLKRNDFSKEEIQVLRNVFSLLFEELNGTMVQRIMVLDKTLLDYASVRSVYEFIAKDPSRSFCFPRRLDEVEKEGAEKLFLSAAN